MLAVNSDEVKVELSLALILGILEDDLEVSGLLVCLEGDSVRVVWKLHDFSKVGDRDSQDHVWVSTVALEAIHAQVERDQGYMGAVHSLERDAYKRMLTIQDSKNAENLCGKSTKVISGQKEKK